MKWSSKHVIIGRTWVFVCPAIEQQVWYSVCFLGRRVQLFCAERRTLRFFHLVKWKLKMSNIKPGDIIISKAGNTWISRTIAWLTESDVSHAAIVLPAIPAVVKAAVAAAAMVTGAVAVGAAAAELVKRCPRPQKSEKCTPEQQAILRAAVDIACGTRESPVHVACSMSLSVNENLVRSAKAHACANARRTYQRTCWQPSDPRWKEHQQQISEKEKAARNCSDIARRQQRQGL